MADYLGRHPNVFFPNIKEPHYFCTDFDAFRRIRTLSEYESLFPFSNSRYEIFGDASVWHLYSNRATEEVFKYNPDAKIIIMLRNPSEMLPSLHNQLVFSGRESIQDFNIAWRKVALRKRGREVPDHVIEPSHLYYDEVCKYGEQVSRVLSVFAKNKVKVIFFEEFRLDPKQTVKDVLSFVGLSSDFEFTASIVNKARRHRFPEISRFVRYPPFPLSVLKRLMKSFTFIKKRTPMRKFYEIMSEDVEKPIIQSQVKQDIQDTYSSDIYRLIEICKRIPADWRW